MEVWRGQNSEVCRIAWHPIHETLMVSGGFNGSLAYWMCGQHQTPHSIIGDAHRQMIEMLAWHPGGYVLASGSHDCLLKFWCREPPGSRLDPSIGEAQDNAPVYMHGPLPVGTGYVQVRQPVTFVNAEPRHDRGDRDGRGRGDRNAAIPSVIRNIPRNNYNKEKCPMVVAAAVAQEEEEGEEEVPEAEDMALAVVDLVDLDLVDQVGDVDGVQDGARDGVLVGGVQGGVLVGARARDIGDLPHQDYFGFAVALPTLIPLVNLKLLS
eukprot:gene729-516_t